ncbi:hypothetical protein TPA0906_44590 [Streptomyces olivaceus]|nr:hypothetical protein TPA0906_44590 [Streptomyces olivaceus]
MRPDAVDAHTLQIVDLLRHRRDSLMDEAEELRVQREEIERQIAAVDHEFSQVNVAFEAMSRLLPEEDGSFEGDEAENTVSLQPVLDETGLFQAPSHAPGPTAEPPSPQPAAGQPATEVGKATSVDPSPDRLAGGDASDPVPGITTLPVDQPEPGEVEGAASRDHSASSPTPKPDDEPRTTVDESFDTERDAILTILGTSEAPMRARDMLDALQALWDSGRTRKFTKYQNPIMGIREIIKQMSKTGAITRVSPGLYTVPEHVSPPVSAADADNEAEAA